jgi:hypothetical protein
MKKIYPKELFLILALFVSSLSFAQSPSGVTTGLCPGLVANFNTNDNGYNSPSVYTGTFDSSLYYHAGRGYWTDYLPPMRTTAPGAPRVMTIISPPYVNPSPVGTFNIGFYYIVPNPAVDRFQVRIISVTQTPQGTVTNVEASSGVQPFNAWSTPTAYIDGTTTTVPDPTPFMGMFQGTICIRLIDTDITNGPSTTYRVEVAYLISTPQFAVFDNLSIGPDNIPLPVNFIGLIAQRNSMNVDLKWDVSEEVDVREYQVERSRNGSSFETAGTVMAKGKSIYTFTNYNVPKENLYYRIKSIDIDGKSKYSGIIRLAGENSYSNELSLYPVPAKDQVTLQHNQLTEKSRIIISTMDGKVVMTMTPREGASHTPINISGLTQGMYLLRLDDGKGDIRSVKLVKN